MLFLKVSIILSIRESKLVPTKLIKWPYIGLETKQERRRLADFYLNPFTSVGYRNNYFFSHTNPYILNVTQQCWWSYFELGLPALKREPMRFKLNQTFLDFFMFLKRSNFPPDFQIFSPIWLFRLVLQETKNMNKDQQIKVNMSKKRQTYE